MQISQVPALLQKAFAASGTKNTIPVASQISITPGAASLTDGFPPLTMTPLAAGGVPPYGADTNGILNWLSQICQWSNAGGTYLYDATFSTAIGGYPKGALIQKASGVGYWVSSVDNNTTDPDTGGAGWVGFDPSTLQAGSYTSAVDSGTVNALAVTLTPVPTALSAGMQVTTMNVVATNTGAATLNLNGLGVKPIVLPSGAALSGGEIYAGSAATFVYTGSSWMLQTRQPVSGVPSMTFTQVAALTSNQGPIYVSDMAHIYTWVSTAYFTGYRNPDCGRWYGGVSDTPQAWELIANGGTWTTTNPAHARVIARYQELGLTVAQGSWTAGPNQIASLGSGNWMAPDLRNMFQRMSGTDADTANPAATGAYKTDAIQNITGSLMTTRSVFSTVGGSSGAFALSDNSQVDWSGAGSSYNYRSASFDASRVARTSVETRPASTRVAPVILI